MPSPLAVVKVVKFFAKLGQELKNVTKATYDGKDMDVQEAAIAIDKNAGTMRIAAKFKTGAPITKIEAVHPVVGDDPDVIKVDGADVNKDDVDLDYDVHWLRVDLEYILKYRVGQDQHKVVLTASKAYLG